MASDRQAYADDTLSKTLIDMDCSCVREIRESPCNMAFISFATCHNRILMTARGQVPDLRKCSSQWARMNACFARHNLRPKALIDTSSQQSDASSPTNGPKYMMGGVKRDVPKLSQVTE